MIILVILAMTLFRNIQDLRQYDFSISVVPLLFSFFLIILMYFQASVAWNRILRNSQFKHGITKTALTYFLGLAGKYIPGKVWVAAIRVLHLGSDDYRRQTGKDVFVTVVIEHLYHLASGILFASLVFDTNSTIGIPRFYSITLSAILCAVVIFVPNKLLRTINRLFKKHKSDMPTIGITNSLLYFFNYFLLWVLLSLAISIFVGGTLKLPVQSLITIGAAYAASVILGFLVLPAPGGIGFREGSFVLLTSNILSPSVAILIGVALRILLVAAEISGLFFFYVLDNYTQNLKKKEIAHLESTKQD